MSWTPNDLSNTLQDVLDDERGSAYADDLIGTPARPYLRPLRTDLGDTRAPRGQRCYRFTSADNTQVALASSLGPFADYSLFAHRLPVANPSNSTIIGDTPAGPGGVNFIRHATLANYQTNHSGTQQAFVFPDRPGPEKLIVSRSGSDLRMHRQRDGVIEESTTGTLTQTNPFYWGFIGGRNTQYYDGYFFRLMFFDFALSDDERLWLFTQGQQGTEPADPIHAFWMNEENGLDSFDAWGGAHGTIQNATLVDFHATDPGVTSNPANELGHTNNAGVIVPRDESDPANDVQGNPLQFTGKAPLPIETSSPCLTFTTGSEFITVPHLTGTETITSYEGTGTPSIAAGRINCTAGTLSSVLIDDGTYLPLCENDLTTTTVYDCSSAANLASLSGFTLADAWADRIVIKDHSVIYGGRVGSNGEFIPGKLDGSAAADGNPLEKLAGKLGNPHSRFIRDPYTPPELAHLNIPVEQAPGDLLRNLAPDETKYGSEQNPTLGSDGTPFDDGTDRVFTVAETLTGTDRDDAWDYIQRTGVGPTFVPAWAVRSTHIHHFAGIR